MKKYTPNSIPLKARIWLAAGIVVFLLFATAELFIGYTYLPGRNGGFLISGFPTLLLVFASLSLCLAMALTIVDHYDKRPNEHMYKQAKKLCYYTTFYLVIAAPAVEFVNVIFLSFGIDIFPDVRGLASGFTFYSPAWKQYLVYVDPIVGEGLSVIGVSVLLLVVAFVIMQYYPQVPTRVWVLLGCMSLFGFFFIFLVATLQDIFSGKLRVNGSVITAVVEPAKYNAIILTHLTISILMTLACLAAFLAIALNRVKFIDQH